MSKFLGYIAANGKAYIAGVGMLGLGLYQLSQAQYTEAVASITGGATIIVQRINAK